MDVDLIYGPPGTGKTTTLMNTLEKELKTTAPERIAYVSFTRKGTYEGMDRAIARFGFNREQLLHFRTIHSLAFRAMAMSRDDMISKEHYKQFSEAMGMKFTGYYTEDLSHDDDRYLFFNTLYRNNKYIGDAMVTDLNPKILKWVSNNYKNFKNTLGIYDFTDLLEMYIEAGDPFPVDVAIIDEAQDLTTLQWKFIWKAFKNCKKVYIAGDDDQAIYEWSGADVNYFLTLKGQQNILSKSWRLPETIHNYSAKVAGGISKRIKKDFTHNGSKGTVELINSYKEAVIDSENSWLFLSRNTYHMNQVERWLREKAMVYTYRGKPSVNMDIVKAIKAHHKKTTGTRVSANENLLLKYYMEKGRSKFEHPWFEEFGRLKDETISYYRDLISNKTDLTKCNITLSTIHGAKGGEADNVVVLLEYNKRIQTNMIKNTDAEMRCYYVAVTRARKNLFLALPEGRYGYPYLK